MNGMENAAHQHAKPDTLQPRKSWGYSADSSNSEADMTLDQPSSQSRRTIITSPEVITKLLSSRCIIGWEPLPLGVFLLFAVRIFGGPCSFRAGTRPNRAPFFHRARVSRQEGTTYSLVALPSYPFVWFCPKPVSLCRAKRMNVSKPFILLLF